MSDISTGGGVKQGNESLLFLTDEQLRRGIEAMFFAYRAFTADPDRISGKLRLWPRPSPGDPFHQPPAGANGQHFADPAWRHETIPEPGSAQSWSKTALSKPAWASKDKRERHLYLTEKGAALERELSEAQRTRMRAAYRAAGPTAVAGFRQVLEAMMDPELRKFYGAMKDGAA